MDPVGKMTNGKWGCGIHSTHEHDTREEAVDCREKTIDAIHMKRFEMLRRETTDLSDVTELLTKITEQNERIIELLNEIYIKI